MKILIFLVALLLAPLAQAQKMVQGPVWIGSTLEVKGIAIGWQNTASGGCLLVLLERGEGRVWACNKSLATPATQWILEGRVVRVRGRVDDVQKTRVGPRWRWAPKISQATID